MPAKNENDKVVEPKRTPGRPPMGDQNMRLFRVYLSEEQHQKALVTGDGIYGEGIRIMIDAYTPPAPPKRRGRPPKAKD